MNMAIRKVFTSNGVGLPFYVQGLPGPLAWSRLVPRFFIEFQIHREMKRPILILFLLISACGPLNKLDLSAIHIGMDKNQVKEALNRPPERVIGAKQYSNGVIEVHAYGVPEYSQEYGKSIRQFYWLYFLNDTLVQWGRPGDWEVMSDHIYELRIK